MRALVAIIILAVAACAMLSAHAHKPFELRIDASPAAWPAKAASDQDYIGPMIICEPVLMDDGLRKQRAGRIVRT